MHLHVQLACAVRCSATGNPLSDAALDVTVNGERRKFLRRSDGYIVYTNLTDGEYRLRFRHPYYKDAECTVRIVGEETCIEVVTMRPAQVIGNNLCRLHVTGMLPGSTAYISGKTYPLHLTGNVAVGEKQIPLFKKGNFRLIPPLRILCADESAPETAILLDMLNDELWCLTKPLQYDHKRGVKLYPTQPYEASDDGTTDAVFFVAGPVSLLYEGKLYELNVEEGEQTWQIPQ